MNGQHACDHPEPLVPADADVRGFKDMPLDVSRLVDSTVWISLTPVGQAASINLWMRAWNQVPAGSLPDNDRVLEHFSMVGAEWAEVRDAVLSKWVKCSDGRLYHPFLCGKVNKMLDVREQKQAGAAARWKRKQDAKEKQPETGSDAPADAEAMQQHSRNDAPAMPPSLPLPSPPSVEEGTKVPCRKRKASYPQDFEDFWRDYPTDANMSKLKAYEKWKRLSDDDKRKCAASVPGFRKYCSDNTTYRPVHACRFISERRFDGFAAADGGEGQQFMMVRKGTPQWDAWRRYGKEQGKRFFPEVMTVPSEYPPVGSTKTAVNG